MDILQFTRELTATQASGLHRWAESTQLSMIEAVLHLAHYEDELSAETRVKYGDVLRDVLAVVPEHARLGVSSSLRRRLYELVTEDAEPNLRRLLGEFADDRAAVST